MTGSKLPDAAMQSADGQDDLFAGLSCLTLAYPAVAATERAWTALFAGIGSLFVLMLVWAVIHLLRAQGRFPRGDYPVVLFGVVFSVVIYPVFCLVLPEAKGLHPLPLILTPLLLLFQALPMLRVAGPSLPPRRAAFRIAVLGGAAAGMLLVLACLREALTYGTVFGHDWQRASLLYAGLVASTGLIAAGLALGCLRWIAMRVGESVSKGGHP
jgi:hypothetical protein